MSNRKWRQASAAESLAIDRAADFNFDVERSKSSTILNLVLGSAAPGRIYCSHTHTHTRACRDTFCPIANLVFQVCYCLYFLQGESLSVCLFTHKLTFAQWQKRVSPRRRARRQSKTSWLVDSEEFALSEPDTPWTQSKFAFKRCQSLSQARRLSTQAHLIALGRQSPRKASSDCTKEWLLRLLA